MYGGVRLKTTAYLGNAKIHITIDVGFGDAISDPGYNIVYPSLLDLPSANIRAYAPATVIAEKFEAAITLGVINSRMKDFYDLWTILRTITIPEHDLTEAVNLTFNRRRTRVPT